MNFCKLKDFFYIKFLLFIYIVFNNIGNLPIHLILSIHNATVYIEKK